MMEPKHFPSIGVAHCCAIDPMCRFRCKDTCVRVFVRLMMHMRAYSFQSDIFYICIYKCCMRVCVRNKYAGSRITTSKLIRNEKEMKQTKQTRRRKKNDENIQDKNE